MSHRALKILNMLARNSETYTQENLDRNREMYRQELLRSLLQDAEVITEGPAALQTAFTELQAVSIKEASLADLDKAQEGQRASILDNERSQVSAISEVIDFQIESVFSELQPISITEASLAEGQQGPRPSIRDERYQGSTVSGEVADSEMEPGFAEQQSAISGASPKEQYVPETETAQQIVSLSVKANLQQSVLNVAFPQNKRKISYNEVYSDSEAGENSVACAKQARVYSRAIRSERKTMRNRGKEYTDVKGRVHAARKSQALKECRMNCKDRITDTEREKLFEEYWSLGDHDKRASYVSSLIRTREKATCRLRHVEDEKRKYRFLTHSYSLNIGNKSIPICKGCFLRVLGETNSFIEVLLANKQGSLSGIPDSDKRGKEAPPKKWSDEAKEEARKHILSFPQYESHYSRSHTQRKFLPSHLTIATMYKLYCDITIQPVSKTIYESIFHSLNLAFKKPKCDTCHKCDFYQMRIKVLQREGKDDSIIQKEFMDHKEQADNAYNAKKRDKENAINSEATRVIVFDLQQCLPTPNIKTNVSFYKRQLWTYNLTLHDCTTKDVTCYMWHEGIAARGANEIASCIYKHILSNLSEEVKHIVLYSDNCGGQNRNNHILAMLTTVLQKTKHLQVIDHKFMISGHSHLECDYDHSIIERKKKHTSIDIFHPRDWYQLVRTAAAKKPFRVVEMTQNDFLDFAALLKKSLVVKKVNENKEKFLWNEAKWIRYTKDFGIIKYKKSHNENDDFHILNCKRRGVNNPCLEIDKCYKGPNAISEKKKKDLIDLLEFIDPLYHSFYANLLTKSNVNDEDPDLRASDEEIIQ